jgi:hypothetical protein
MTAAARLADRSDASRVLPASADSSWGLQKAAAATGAAPPPRTTTTATAAAMKSSQAQVAPPYTLQYGRAPTTRLGSVESTDTGATTASSGASTGRGEMLQYRALAPAGVSPTRLLSSDSSDADGSPARHYPASAARLAGRPLSSGARTAVSIGTEALYSADRSTGSVRRRRSSMGEGTGASSGAAGDVSRQLGDDGDVTMTEGQTTCSVDCSCVQDTSNAYSSVSVAPPPRPPLPLEYHDPTRPNLRPLRAVLRDDLSP